MRSGSHCLRDEPMVIDSALCQKQVIQRSHSHSDASARYLGLVDLHETGPAQRPIVNLNSTSASRTTNTQTKPTHIQDQEAKPHFTTSSSITLYLLPSPSRWPLNRRPFRFTASISATAHSPRLHFDPILFGKLLLLGNHALRFCCLFKIPTFIHICKNSHHLNNNNLNSRVGLCKHSHSYLTPA